jgi:hypothetical protein
MLTANRIELYKVDTYKFHPKKFYKIGPRSIDITGCDQLTDLVFSDVWRQVPIFVHVPFPGIQHYLSQAY